jgi:hypothetical protein
MKIILFLLLMVSTFKILAGEIDDISIITPTSYETTSSSSQTFASKVKVGIGDIINADAVALVKKKIAPYSKDLTNYFPKPGELDSFVDKIAQEGKNTYLSEGLSDSKLIRFYEFLGNKLVGGFVDKILSAKGVTDLARREIWVKKILAPFQECIGRSKNSQYDASHCMDTLTTSLVPSAGIGIVYELSRTNLSSSMPEDLQNSFNKNQVNNYKSCLAKTKNLASDVENCALVAMRSGVINVTDTKLSKTISEATSTPVIAKSVKNLVWPEFTTCTQKVGTDKSVVTGISEQFMDCIDGLVSNTGIQIVQDKIKTNSSVKLNFKKSEIEKISLDESKSFKECVQTQKKNNIRTAGMLDTHKCENIVTNDITYKVVLKTLSQSANDSFKNDTNLGLKFSNSGKEILDLCWANDQNPKQRDDCLKKTIITFSQSIAANKLDAAIPKAQSNKKELTAISMAEFGKCLEKQLPSNISEAQNLNSQIKNCSIKLTLNVALEIAKASVQSAAFKSKIDPQQTEEMLNKFVETQFKKCLGESPTDLKISQCSGELKKDVAMTIATSQVRASANGKMTSKDSEELVNTLVNQNFKSCIGSTPTDAQLDECVANLTKAATKSIVISYEKKQILEQLSTVTVPKNLKVVESNFSNCVDKPIKTSEVSKKMDDCTKAFALDFAKELGELKLNSLMQSILGLNSYNDQKKTIEQILFKYNECLDDLKKYEIQDGLLDKISTCTEGLERRGINLVSNTINTWMSTEEKDAATLIVKNEFARLIPCLGGFLPSTPYSPTLQANAESILKPVSLMIAQYIEYSPEVAKRTLDEITKKLAGDLKDVATNPDSRKALIDTLYINGALDQFLKSMIRSEVKSSIEKISDSDLPKDLKTALLAKDNFDKIFASAEGKVLKDMVMEKMLKPILMDQASVKSPLMVAAMDSVKDRVIKILVSSPHFGDQIIKSSVQNQINNLDKFTRFMAKALYGSKSLNWEQVRTSANGIIAENYIRENILLPKFKGTIFSKEEENKINTEAEKLVKAAIKKYD